MEDGLITYVIISQNTSDYISTAINTLEKQNGFNGKIIVISSEDYQYNGTYEKVEVYIYKDTSLMELYLHGLNYSDTDYVLFAHADVRFKAGLTAKLIDCIKRNKDLVIFAQEYVDGDVYGFNILYLSQYGDMDVSSKFHSVDICEPNETLLKFSPGMFFCKTIKLKQMRFPTKTKEYFFYWTIISTALLHAWDVEYIDDCYFQHFFLEDFDYICSIRKEELNFREQFFLICVDRMFLYRSVIDKLKINVMMIESKIKELKNGRILNLFEIVKYLHRIYRIIKG